MNREHRERLLDNLRHNNQLYLLYVIREGADTWNKLVEHFGLLGTGTTDKFMLAKALETLEKAGVVCFVGSLYGEGSSSGHFWNLSQETNRELRIAYDDRAPLHSIKITSSGMAILLALGVSLEQHSQVLKGHTVTSRPKFPIHRSSLDVFVAMPFSEPFNTIYSDHISPSLKRSGLSVLRVDEIVTPETITNDIFSSILSAEITVADCSGRNPNVFYEIGLAHALGKQVVLTTQRAEDVPFDVRHIRYIQYDFTPRGMQQFEQKLSDVVRSLIPR